jgi:hypothetical protein
MAMKQGMDIQQLANELKRQAASAVDYNANQGALRMDMLPEPVAPPPVPDDHPEAGNGSVLDDLLSKVDLEGTAQAIEEAEGPLIPQLTLRDVQSFPIKSIAHQQLASHLKIPKAYYDRMLLEKPELLTNNVNTWLEASQQDQRMVRTLDGKVRAYLSSSYRRIDNLPLMIAVIQTAAQMGCKVASCSVTDEHLYLKLTSEKLKGEVKVGDVVQAGLLIRNSEVGRSTVRVEPMIIRLSCWNGAVMATAIKKRHVGRRTRVSDDDGVEQLLTDETKKMDDAAFMMKIRDVVRGSFREDLFNMNMDKLKAAHDRKIETPAKPTVEVLSKRWSLSEAESDSTLQALIEGSDLTQWGMANAVTLMSQGVKSYDRASELETVGGEILQMDGMDWDSFLKQVTV